MPTYLFPQLEKKALSAGITKMTTKKARDWFRDAAQSVSRADPKKLLDSAQAFERVQTLSPNLIGKMYFFNYDAKHKDTLPYWDRFPIIFLLEIYPDTRSCLGINLHYLPPIMRAKLMNALYTTMNNKKYDKTTQLIISYKILKNASQFAAFKPCLKMYLFDHVRSPFLYIKPDYWDMCAFLPTARFDKASQNRVWFESMAKL